MTHSKTLWVLLLFFIIHVGCSDGEKSNRTTGGLDGGADGDTDGDTDTDTDSDTDSDSDGGTKTDSDSNSDSDTNNDTDSGELTYAQDISLDAIEFNQGVAVKIAADGKHIPASKRNVKLVKNRGGLFRAIWKLKPGWSNRKIKAELTLKYSDGTESVFTDTKMINNAPNLNKLDGTFKWILESDDVEVNMEYSVVLYEVTNQGAPDPASPPRIPQNGTINLGVPDTRMVMEITLVPVTIKGETPDFGEQNKQAIVNGFYNMNPLSELKATYHEPVVVKKATIGAVLNTITALRSAENAAPQMYYIGLAPVSKTKWNGLSWMASDKPGAKRASAAPVSNKPWNYPDDKTWGYTVHELGHAQGRKHNPGCDAGDTDPNWPFGDDNTKINIQGYDLANNKLRAADKYEDYMNYCFPDWPSAFTWKHTGIRIKKLSSWTTTYKSTQREWTLRGIISSNPDEAPIWSAIKTISTPPSQEATVTATITLTSGSVIKKDGMESLLGDGKTTGIDLPLSTDPSKIKSIILNTSTKTFHVLPEGLADLYYSFL